MIKLLLSINRLLAAALLFAGISGFAQSAGFDSTFLVLGTSTSFTYYDLQAATSNADFNGANLGTFCQGNTNALRLRGAEHNVYKCGGCDLTSTRIYYRVYLTSGGPSGTFANAALPFASGGNNGCGGQNQQWATTGLSVNLLNGLAAGNYTLEVYSDASVTCSGGTVYSSNNSANYKANFTVSANVTYYFDNDGDGFGGNTLTQVSCTGAPVGYVSNNTDCNDNNANAFVSSAVYIDADADNYDDGTLTLCHGTAEPNGFSFITNGPDCSDTNPAIYRSATLYIDADGDGYNTGEEEVCFGASIPVGYAAIDNGPDCDDTNASVYRSGDFYVDADGDGFNTGEMVTLCYGATIPAGYTDTDIDIDCDDALLLYVDADDDGFGSNVFSACDGVENNDDCDDNNSAVGGNGTTYYADVDGDGYGNPDVTINSCSQPQGYVLNSSDCNDQNNQIHPGAVEICNGIDDDCDGFIDGADPSLSLDGLSTYYQDNDNDGFGNPSVSVTTCVLPAGYVMNNSDCDDTKILYADLDGDGFGNGAAQVACGVANAADCNDNVIFYQDLDGDGFGSEIQVGCGVSNSDDCDDSQVLYADLDGDGFGNGAAQVACGVANAADCNDNVIFYQDLDGDGFGSDVQVGCGVSNSDDCDDNNASIYRTAQFYVDADNDGYNNGTTQTVCYGATVPQGFVSENNGADCNDNNASVYRSAQFYVDADNDGYNNGTTQTVCYGDSLPAGYTDVNLGLDCNDNSDVMNPSQEEILGNGIDDNCNGETDEGGPQVFTQLQPAQCGITLPSISTLMGAVTKKNVTAYRFRVTNLTDNTVQTTVRTVGHFQLTSLPSYDYSTTYSIEVELQISGNWVGSYGPACTVATPDILNEGGAASVAPDQCGITLASLSTLVASKSLKGVTGYRFRITNTLTNEVQTIDRKFYWFAFTMLDTYNYGTTYSVEVAMKTTGDYSPYGQPCFVSTPPVPSLTNCDFTAPSASANIATTSLNRVTSYRFEITSFSDFTTIYVDRSVNWFRFLNVPDYVPGGQYAVRVSVQTAGTWSPYGETCIITAPGASRSSAEADAPQKASFRAVVYPNPYAESFALDLDVAGDSNVKVRVYDMIGKLIEEQEIAVDQIETKQFGERYPSGVYNIIVTQGEYVKTLRVVKR